MTSVNTNTGAMLALSTLRSINGQLSKTESQISSGLRISNASDNAAYWSIATTMRSDNAAKSAAADSIGIGKAVLDVTYNGMDRVREELTSIRNLVLTASSLPPPPTNGYSNWTEYEPDEIYNKSLVAKVDLEINQHWNMIDTIIESSSFSGINLLKNEKSEPTLPGAKTEFVTGYADGKVQTISISTQDTAMVNYNRTMDNMYGQPGSENQGFLDGIFWSANIVLPYTHVDAFSGDVVRTQNTYMLRNVELEITSSSGDRAYYYEALIQQIDERIDAVTDGMTVVGSTQKRLDMQDVFNQALMDNITNGVGRLVDADMNEASAKLKALQTQQQLAVQGLGIANSTPANLLTLFQ